jgi:hypothetical protein
MNAAPPPAAICSRVDPDSGEFITGTGCIEKIGSAYCLVFSGCQGSSSPDSSVDDDLMQRRKAGFGAAAIDARSADSLKVLAETPGAH